MTILETEQFVLERERTVLVEYELPERFNPFHHKTGRRFPKKQCQILSKKGVGVDRQGRRGFGKVYRTPAFFVRLPAELVKQPAVQRFVKEVQHVPEWVTIRQRSVPSRARYEEHAYTSNWSDVSDAMVEYYNGFNWASGSALSWVGRTVTQKWSSNDDLALMGKLRERVAGSDFNMAVMLAEAPQSLQLIADAATRIRKGLSALQRGNLAEAIKQLAGHKKARKIPGTGGVKSSKTVQQNWLALQYGWLPLVKDVKGAIDFVDHQLSAPIQQTLRVRRRVSGDVYYSGKTKCLGDVIETSKSIKVVLKEKSVVRLLGLTDPASVVWEKIPFSFIADWFIPIGNYLSARGLSQSLEATYVVSTKTVNNFTGWVNTDPFYKGKHFLTAGKVWQQSGSLTRTVNPTIQIPLPSWKPLSKAASWLHCANAVALLTSRDWGKRG